ncbi:MAG: glycoside hydrolase domain-containing protein, partial [Ginsengibacter sp.]
MNKLFLFLFILFPFNHTYSQNIPYTNCNNCWNPDSLGNHRVVLQVAGNEKIVKVLIPWRRRDADPQDKRIIIEDAKSKQKVLNVKSGNLNRESGEIYFEPISGKGIYYVYYMPYKNEGRSNYPKGVYLKPENTASAEWLELVSKNMNIPAAKVKEFQSVDAFNSFSPMEVIATKSETDQLIAQNKNQPFIIFPEDRLHS